MGQVLLKYRVMPEGLEVDLAQLEKNVAAAMPAGVARLSKATAVPFSSAPSSSRKPKGTTTRSRRRSTRCPLPKASSSSKPAASCETAKSETE
jgi:hypothetical protein